MEKIGAMTTRQDQVRADRRRGRGAALTVQKMKRAREEFTAKYAKSAKGVAA